MPTRLKLMINYSIDLSTAEVIKKSKKTAYTYYLFQNELYVCDDNEDIVKCFEIPKNDKLICFYAIYYIFDDLYVIFSTHGSYDIAYILNEDDLTLIRKGFYK